MAFERGDREREERAWRGMEEAARRDLRERYLETTPEQRLVSAMELSGFARELRAAMLAAEK